MVEMVEINGNDYLDDPNEDMVSFGDDTIAAINQLEVLEIDTSQHVKLEISLKHIHKKLLFKTHKSLNRSSRISTECVETKSHLEQTKEEISHSNVSILCTQQKQDLASWGLPKNIIKQYESRGITSMFPWQVECLSNARVLAGGNLVYSAPTSAGKTLVAEILAIKTVLERKKKVIIILPFVSVVREKMFYFQSLLSSSGVRVEGLMGSHSLPGGFKNVNIAVCTIEKANSLLNRLLEEGTLNCVGTVVVDELHLLGDPFRGYLLELLLTKIQYMCSINSNISIQVIGMSATLPNLQLLAKWLSADLYKTDFRPIPLQEFLKVGTTVYSKNMKMLSTLKLHYNVQDDPDHVIHLCLQTIFDGHSVLIFCPTKNWCEKLSQSIAKELCSIGNSGSDTALKLRKQLNSTAIAEALEQLKRCPVGLDVILKRVVAFAVSFHHAGLTMDERDIIEGLFRAGTLRVLVATSTLSSGVNLPARRVIVRTPLFHGRPLEVQTYQQMIGRAGRMGKDTAGESFLVCNKGEKQMAQKIVQADLKPIESCLGHGELSSSLKRAILEVIASRVVETPDQVQVYTNCTLLATSESDLDSPVLSCVEFLVGNEFIRLQTTDDGMTKYVPTPLGQACLAASMSPDDGLELFKELQKARQCFVLENELHIIYLVTPYSVSSQWVNLDWLKVLSLWEKLPASMRRVGELIGIEERFMVRAMRGTLGQQNSKQRHKLSMHRRFYTSLALQDLVNEVPLNEVAEKFHCSRGMLQSLQQSAATFAGMVTAFCRRLGWGSVELLVSQFQDRLQFGIHRELCDLMRLELLNGPRARALFSTGITTLTSLAASDVCTVENALHKATPFQSSKELDGESTFDTVRRNQLKSIWVTGRQGLTEREAASLLIKEARVWLQQELGLVDAKWQSISQPSSVSDYFSQSEISDIADDEQSDNPPDHSRPRTPVKVNQSDTENVHSVRSNTLQTSEIAHTSKCKIEICDEQNIEMKSSNLSIDHFSSPIFQEVSNMLNDDLKPQNLVDVVPSNKIKTICKTSNECIEQNNISVNEINDILYTNVPDTKNINSSSSAAHDELRTNSMNVNCNSSQQTVAHSPMNSTYAMSTPKDKYVNESGIADNLSAIGGALEGNTYQSPTVTSKRESLDCFSSPLGENLCKSPSLFGDSFVVDTQLCDALDICNGSSSSVDRKVKAESLEEPVVQPNMDKPDLTGNNLKDPHLIRSYTLNSSSNETFKGNNGSNFNCNSKQDNSGKGTLNVKNYSYQSLRPRKRKRRNLNTSNENQIASQINDKLSNDCDLSSTNDDIITDSFLEKAFTTYYDIDCKSENCGEKQAEKKNYNQTVQLSSTLIETIDTSSANSQKGAMKVLRKSPRLLALQANTLNVGAMQKSSVNERNKSKKISTLKSVSYTGNTKPATCVPTSKIPIEEPTKGQINSGRKHLKFNKVLKFSSSSEDEGGVITASQNVLKPSSLRKKSASKLKTEHNEVHSPSTSKSKICKQCVINDNRFISKCSLSPSRNTDNNAREETWQLINIINVCGNRQLFNTFQAELALHSHLSLAVACERHCQEEPSVAIGNRILGKRRKQQDNIPKNPFSFGNRIVSGMAVSFGCMDAYYLPVNTHEGCGDLSVPVSERINVIKTLVSSDKTQQSLRMLDVKEQYKVLHQCCGISIQRRVWDPKVADWLLEPEGKEKNLQAMVLKYLPLARDMVDMVGSIQGISSPALDVNNSAPARLRACVEAVVTWGVLDEQLKMLTENHLIKMYREVEMPTILCLARMELTGIRFSKAEAEKLKVILENQMSALEEKAYKLAGHTFSLTSPADVAKILYVELALNGGNQLPGRKQSTSKEVLAQLKNKHPLPSIILQWRKINAIITKMVFPLLKAGTSECMYGHYVTHTATGRISMHEPNMQNIPRDFDISDNDGKPLPISMRHAFIPMKGKTFVSADYCQLELRILAHLSDDQVLCRILNSGQDVFCSIAALSNKIQECHVTDALRQRAKQICYGMIYGMGTKALAEQLDVEEPEAAVFMETFKNSYPGVKKFLHNTVVECKKNGFVKTLLGRRRYLPSINSSNHIIKGQAERQAVNSAIQGSAADIAKTGMVLVESSLNMAFPSTSVVTSRRREVKRTRTAEPAASLVLHLHDELLYEVVSDKVAEVVHIIKVGMEAAANLSVSLPVKIRCGESWGTLKDAAVS